MTGKPLDLFDQAKPVGWRRILALALLLTAVSAVAFLAHVVAGGLDLELLYFMIVLTAAVLLPRWIVLALALAVAVVSAGLSESHGVALGVNLLSHALIYGYAALLTGNWEQERQRLLRMSRVDDLTGLFNMRALREQLPVWLGPAVRTHRSMAIVMLDVDGFKAVNDHLGHQAGNEVLREVANVLRMSIRVGDSVFRFGGDEFVILLSDTDAAGARVVAERIQKTYHDMHQTLPASGLSVSLSIGLAVFPRDGATPQALLSRADEALYEAKRRGHGQVIEYGDRAPDENAA
jgi:diguanylate cyclase (GGDEF)-like protein